MDENGSLEDQFSFSKGAISTSMMMRARVDLSNNVPF